MSLRSVALSTALLLAMAGFGLAQNDPSEGQYPPAQYPVYGQPQYATNQAYQNGFQDGLNDGAHDRQTNHGFRASKTEKYEDADSGYNSSFGDKNQYKQIYRQGYAAGYQQGFSGQAPVAGQAYPVYGPPQAPVYGQPSYGANPAYQNGFQDGLNDGAQDQQSNHGFRATNTKNYNHADNGYNSSLGDKMQYQGFYRQGYVAGYQQGYGGQGPAAGQPPYPVYGQPPYPVYGQPYPAYPPQYPVAGQPGQAYQIGYQDGINDGMHDRQSGHKFRPTKTEKYEDAPGYNKSFGDKNEYKNTYRQGYVAGYERAFGSR